MKKVGSIYLEKNEKEQKNKQFTNACAFMTTACFGSPFLFFLLENLSKQKKKMVIKVLLKAWK